MENHAFTLLDSALNVPDLKTFLEPLKEQLDPEDMIEEEYRLSRDTVRPSWKSRGFILPPLDRRTCGEPYASLRDSTCTCIKS